MEHGWSPILAGRRHLLIMMSPFTSYSQVNRSFGFRGVASDIPTISHTCPLGQHSLILWLVMAASHADATRTPHRCQTAGVAPELPTAGGEQILHWTSLLFMIYLSAPTPCLHIALLVETTSFLRLRTAIFLSSSTTAV